LLLISDWVDCTGDVHAGGWLNLQFFFFDFLVLVHALKEVLPTFIFKFKILNDSIVLLVREDVLDAWSADVVNGEAIPRA
jgi:hypothetical protein